MSARYDAGECVHVCERGRKREKIKGGKTPQNTAARMLYVSGMVRVLTAEQISGHL